MADREKREAITQVIQRNLGEHYPPPCNYLLVQATELLPICLQKYGGNVARFENEFVKPVAELLDTLRINHLPIMFEDTTNRQTYVLVHLTEPQLQKMTPGEVVIWVGKNLPGTLSMRYTRYVTEREGILLPDPHYEETKMRVQAKDVVRCLTTAYFSELRASLKEKGAERYSLAMRLFIAYNATTTAMKSLDYDQVLVHRKRRIIPKPRPRSESGVQESGEDPVSKSTEVQELRQAISTYRTHRQSQQGAADQDDYRSSSPTGTEASNMLSSGQDRLTDDDSSDDNDDAIENGFLNGHGENNDLQNGGLEPEATVKLTKPVCSVKPRDEYLEQNKAVGPNTNQGKEADQQVASKPPLDGYVE